MTKYIKAPRELVYRALIDPEAIAIWKAPNGVTCHVHELLGVKC